MVRKAPATTKHKGSQKNETYMAGITDASDYLQQFGSPDGIQLDESVAREAREKSAEDILNAPDYNVPAGVQLTENLIEEIAEGAQKKTPERPAEK